MSTMTSQWCTDIMKLCVEVKNILSVFAANTRQTHSCEVIVSGITVHDNSSTKTHPVEGMGGLVYLTGVG